VPVYLQSDRRISSITSLNTGFSAANTWYNSLAATVRRPFSNGLEVIGNYTWSKATDDGQVQGSSGTFYGGDTPLNPNHIQGDNGPSDIDIRNRFTLSFVYAPKLFEDNRYVKHLFDDFTFSGAEIASSHLPGDERNRLLRNRNQLRRGRKHLRRRHEFQLRLGNHRTPAADRPQQHLCAGL
jgi:hypothetical protein